ncbi:hypothetical protein AC579_8289 [Pseudocercospora musae]|uniref:Uncharacterized protein n=1 Tax=Pseudocercospora musae TaxID=113226 RepID=A0A139H0U6_9PEZI|nr:hypothetical protein AC579_8289 [Pseudocercospora musae]
MELKTPALPALALTLTLTLTSIALWLAYPAFTWPVSHASPLPVLLLESAHILPASDAAITPPILRMEVFKSIEVLHWRNPCWPSRGAFAATASTAYYTKQTTPCSQNPRNVNVVGAQVIWVVLMTRGSQILELVFSGLHVSLADPTVRCPIQVVQLKGHIREIAQRNPKTQSPSHIATPSCTDPAVPYQALT